MEGRESVESHIREEREVRYFLWSIGQEASPRSEEGGINLGRNENRERMGKGVL